MASGWKLNHVPGKGCWGSVVEWVERSDPTRQRNDRWVSLRSTHPTLVVQHCLLQIVRASKSSCCHHVMRCLVVSTVAEHRFARNRELIAVDCCIKACHLGRWDRFSLPRPTIRPAVNRTSGGANAADFRLAR